MSFGKSSNLTTLSEILKKVSDVNILKHYIAFKEIPCIIRSPLREDKHPSFGLYMKKGKVHFKDLSTGDKGDVFDLLQKLWNTSFASAIQRVGDDLCNINKEHIKCKNLQYTNTRELVPSKHSTLECKVRNWRKHDLEYWNTYGISLKTLVFGDVFPISHVIIKKDGKTYTIPADKYAYAYVERKDGIISLKIYQPYNDTYKWNNRHAASVWDLWAKLPKTGKDVIITSSRKDALSIWENTGIPSVSLQAESYLPKKSVINELKSRFTNVYILYDNDYLDPKNPGHNLGKHLANLFDLKQIELPVKYESKDSSDLVKNKGRHILRGVIFYLISEVNKIKTI